MVKHADRRTDRKAILSHRKDCPSFLSSFCLSSLSLSFLLEYLSYLPRRPAPARKRPPTRLPEYSPPSAVYTHLSSECLEKSPVLCLLFLLLDFFTQVCQTRYGRNMHLLGWAAVSRSLIFPSLKTEERTQPPDD